MLKIQNYLKSSNDLDFSNLKEKYGINHRRHSKYPNLVLFKYNQIESPFGEEIVRECRGIVLDEKDDWNVVSMAFKKFFNHGEGHAAQLDWNSARVYEKLDGSLVSIYEYNGHWNVATTGTPDASGNIHGLSPDGLYRPRPSSVEVPLPENFAKYFWQVISLDHDFFVGGPQTQEIKDYCFFFELMGPLNRVVVPHEHARAVLLGARNRKTLEEITPEEANFLLEKSCEVVQSYPLNNFSDIIKTFQNISPLSQEGYVVCDSKFNRVKVKHPGYVAIHHAKDGMTTKAFVEIARSGETSEVEAAFPELKNLINEARVRYETLKKQIQEDYDRLKHIEIQKDFAMEANKTKCPSALFTVRAKKFSSVQDFLVSMRVENLMQLLGY